MPYMVNTQQLGTADVPNSALDFLKPQLHGKNVTPYPADDDATLWLFHKVVLKYGWDWMDKYMATKPNFIQGHLGQQRSIASGQNWAAINSIFNITEPMKQSGSPVARISPPSTRRRSGRSRRDFQERVASKRGKAVPDWLLEPAQQAATGTWSPRNDVPPPAGYQADPVVSGRQRLPEFLINESQVVELRKRFEGYTGPVVNAGGVR